MKSNELETLRAELHKEVDAKIDKFIKPIQQFKKGEWVKLINDYGEQLKKGMVFQIVEPQTESLKCFIVDHVAFGLEDRNYLAPYFNYLVPAAPTEVQQALEKEAVKRGFKEGVKFVPVRPNCYNEKHGTCKKDFYFYGNGLCSGENWIFEDGVWADLIKPMSLEDLAIDIRDYICTNGDKTLATNILNYLKDTENKTQIIETLNNL